jgi:type II secretory pathway pseudopilin PulG
MTNSPSLLKLTAKTSRSSSAASRKRSRPGFTVIEFLVGIGMIAILIAILIPYVLSARESSHRAECASHLHLIWNALNQYTSENGNERPFPRVIYDQAHMPTGYTAFTGPDGGNPFAAGSKVKPNDVTASLWLLVRGGYIKDLSAFVCPSTWDEPDRLDDTAQKRGNFRKSINLSYSYACPFSEWKFTSDTLVADFVVIADRNPGFAAKGDQIVGPPRDAPPFELAKGNSRNHQGAGQNVLHGAGDVAFEMTPYCGVSKDNIYTALAAKPLEGEHPPLDVPGYIGNKLSPAYQLDSYLVPTADEGPQ